MSAATTASQHTHGISPVDQAALFPEWRNRNQPTTIDGVTYKIAASRPDREAAFRLVYQAYRRVDLMEPNEFGMRVTPYHLLPTSDVFIAMLDEAVICTLSLIGDGE